MPPSRPPRTEPEPGGKKSPSSDLPGKIGDRVYLVNVVLIGVKVLGEVDLLPGDRLALGGHVVAGVEGAHEDIDVLGIEFALLEPVGEEPVDAVGDLPFEVCHHISLGMGP